MLAALIFGLLGLIVGSFLNVLILRHGVRSLGGRSACLSCGETIRWYDNIPVLSWILLRGRCRSCRARISLQYPLVEGVAAILFAALGGALSPTFGVFSAGTGFEVVLFMLIAFDYLAIIALLIAIFVYDLYYTIIPDRWVWTFNALAFVSQFLIPFSGEFNPWWFVFAGPAAALPLFLLWLVSRGRWMGFGDVKLALGIGWLLGPLFGVIAIFFAFALGAIISVFILLPLPRIVSLLSRIGITSYAQPAAGFTMKSEIPFGPFLICSCLMFWFLLLFGVNPLSIVGLLP